MQVFTMEFRNLEIDGSGSVRSPADVEPSPVTPESRISPRLPGHLTMYDLHLSLEAELN